MNELHWFYYLLFALCLYAGIRSAAGLIAGFKFLRHVSRLVAASGSLRDASGRWKYRPRVTVILPCCGVDERLHQTVARLGSQNYEDYGVVFTFESPTDPAYLAVGNWAASWSAVRHQRIVAGSTTHRSQKIHNLLAAVDAVGHDTEVLVFLDADAVPDENWLGHLVAPLADKAVGAATGFRWYCASGGLANAVRSVWNAASLTLMETDATRFCWGGATAIRRERFTSLDIAGHWDGALSDDLQVTQAVKAAGLRIVFVPQALIPSHDTTTMRDFKQFARRQLRITRICAPKIWRGGLLLCSAFVGGGTVAAVLCIGPLFGWFGSQRVAIIGGAFWGLILVSAIGRCILRQLAVRKLLHPPDLTWRDAVWDITGAVWAGTLHMELFLTSMFGRRIRWRHIEYEMISPSQTRVLRRFDQAADESQEAGPPQGSEK